MISGEMNSSFGVMVPEGRHLNMDPYGGMNMKTVKGYDPDISAYYGQYCRIVTIQ